MMNKKEYAIVLFILAIVLIAVPFPGLVVRAQSQSGEQLTIIKVAVPATVNGIYPAFSFTLTDPNHIVDPSGSANFTLENGNNYTTTFSGFQNAQTPPALPTSNIYTITENTPPGWNPPTISCTGVDTVQFIYKSPSVIFDYTPNAMGPSGHITCTFTDTLAVVPPREDARPDAVLQVIKRLSPTFDSGKFNLKIDGTTAGTGANVGNGGTTGMVNLVSGTHTVSESAGTNTNASDYTTVFSGDCDSSGVVTLSPGDSKQCTITNSKKGPPQLTVTKIVVPSTNQGKFSFLISNCFPLVGCFDFTTPEVGNGQSQGPITLSVGTHTIQELPGTNTDLDDYTAVFSGDCAPNGTVSLALGDNKTCIVTNTKIHHVVVPHSWVTMSSMPTKRYALGVAVVNNILYAMGGGTSTTGCNSAAIKTVEAYDPTTDSWSTKAPMLTARRNFGVVVLNGLIYVIGGHNCTYGSYTMKTVQAYDPATNSWSNKASLPDKRGQIAAAVVNGRIIVMGGIDNSVAFRDTVWAYNPACDVPGSTCAAWSSLHHLPIANRRSSAAVVNGILYDVGGVNSPTNITNVMRAYTVTTNSWATATSMPTKRLGLGVVNVNGTLYAAGGKKSWVGGATGIMETYNPTSATWTTSTPMSFAHYDLGVGVINGVIYAVGGAKDSSVLNKVEAYAP